MPDFECYPRGMNELWEVAWLKLKNKGKVKERQGRLTEEMEDTDFLIESEKMIPEHRKTGQKRESDGD